MLRTEALVCGTNGSPRPGGQLNCPVLVRPSPQWRKSLSLQSSLQLLADIRAVVEIPTRVDAALAERVGTATTALEGLCEQSLTVIMYPNRRSGSLGT